MNPILGMSICSYVNFTEYSKGNLPFQWKAACGPELVAIDSRLEALLLQFVQQHSGSVIFSEAAFSSIHVFFYFMNVDIV